mgnify:CR=1 FL=1
MTKFIFTLFFGEVLLIFILLITGHSGLAQKIVMGTYITLILNLFLYDKN